MPKKKLEKKPINLTKYCYEKRKNWKQNQRFPCFVVSLFASVGEFLQPVSRKEYDQLIVTLYKIFYVYLSIHNQLIRLLQRVNL